MMMMMMMMIEQLLMQLNSDDNSLRQTALNQAVLQKEAITPTLLDIIVQYPKLNGARYNHKAFIAAFAENLGNGAIAVRLAW